MCSSTEANSSFRIGGGGGAWGLCRRELIRLNRTCVNYSADYKSHRIHCNYKEQSGNLCTTIVHLKRDIELKGG